MKRLPKNNCRIGYLALFFHGKLFIVKKHGKKTLRFELKQAGKNLHLTVTLKVLICQDSSCIRPRQTGRVLAALGAQLLCVVPCQGGAERLCTKYDISVFHIATDGKRAVSWRGNRWQEELTYQKTLHISLSLVFSASPSKNGLNSLIIETLVETSQSTRFQAVFPHKANTFLRA